MFLHVRILECLLVLVMVCPSYTPCQYSLIHPGVNTHTHSFVLSILNHIIHTVQQTIINPVNNDSLIVLILSNKPTYSLITSSLPYSLLHSLPLSLPFLTLSIIITPTHPGPASNAYVSTLQYTATHQPIINSPGPTRY